MMMANIKYPSYIMCITLLQLILLSLVEATSWSVNASSDLRKLQDADRLKRDVRTRPEPKFTMEILDGSEEISITWTEVSRSIANKNLPVYFAKRLNQSEQIVHEKLPDNFQDIIVYHDTKLLSSAMFTVNTGRFEGLIGGTYMINVSLSDLSETLSVDGKLVKRYAHRSHGEKNCPLSTEDDDFSAPPPPPLLHNMKERAINSHLNISRLRTRRGDVTETIKEEIFIEVLLFITFDAARSYLDLPPYAVKILVNKYIRDFVAIDMIYASIPTNDFKIYVNLAGVIIEAADHIFADIINYPQLRYDDDRVLDIGFLLDDFQSYSKHKDFPFSRDRYDVAMISTGRELQFGVGRVFGWHRTVPDILDDMMENGTPEVPMVIVQRQYAVPDYCYAVREIGKLLGIKKNDNLAKISSEDGRQCYGVMQPSYHYCSDCMKWSVESVNQLEVFMSENVNHCFLFNKPRSLNPLKPMKSLTPCRQCDCFGYCSEDEDSDVVCPRFLLPNDCSQPLQCKSKDSDGQILTESTILPMNGTPCGANKVCWDGNCVAL